MDEYYLSVSKEMCDLTDDQNTSEPSHQTDQSSRQNNEGENGGYASIAEAVIVGVGLLVPLFWPISVPYVTYRWYKRKYQNLTDHNSSGQNTTEAHISVSTPTTAISSVTDPRSDQSTEPDSDDEVTETCTNTEIVILAVGLAFPLFWPISIPYAIMRYNERPPNRVDSSSETGTGSHSLTTQDQSMQQDNAHDDGETASQICTSTEIVILVVGLAFPLFWPISIPYAIFRYRQHRRNHNDPSGESGIRSVVLPVTTSSSEPVNEITPEFNGSVDISDDVAMIKVKASVDGESEYILDDDVSYRPCNSGYTIKGLSVGLHSITFRFTPAESSQALPKQSMNFYIYPMIDYSVIPDEDTATLTVDTDPKVDGSFHYSLDDNLSFQPWSSGDKLLNLSAGPHCITFQFTPNVNCSDNFSVTKEHKFEIKTIAHTIVTVHKDTATIELYSNAKGEFECSLDEASFKKCFTGKKFSGLSAGPHKVNAHFIGATSLEKIICATEDFNVDQIVKVNVTTMEDGAEIKLDSNFPTKFQYSLNKAEFKPCSSEEMLSKLPAGSYHVMVQFIPTESSLPSLKIVERSVEFEIIPKAWGSVAICKDKAILELTANTDGMFKYTLDSEKQEHLSAKSYQGCLQEIHQLSAGKHSLKIELVTGTGKTLKYEPFIDFIMLSKDWYTSQCQPVRLQNFGNTCFFNSALQSTFKTDVFHQLCLYWPHVLKFYVSTENKLMAFNDHHSPELILEPYMKSYKVPSKTGDASLDISVLLKPGPLTTAWIHLFTNISTSLPVFPFLPSDLLTQLGKRNSRFVKGTQEDSHEAMRCIFDAIKNEEIEQVKKAIKEHFGVTESQTEASLDGEEKLKLKGYLRMATKVPTIIGQVIQGKVVSVTICHECLDVTENEESYFDISLPMPDETLPTFDNGAAAYGWNPDEHSNTINKNSDENGNRISVQLTSSNLNDETELQKANAGGKTNFDATTNGTDICSSQINTSASEGLPTNVEPHEQTPSPKPMDDIPATNVDQHHTPSSDGDECHSKLQNDSKETRSSEGSDTGMVNTPVVKVSGTTATERNPDSFGNYEPVNQASGIRESLILAEHLAIGQKNATQKAEQRPQQNTNKKELNTNELSTSHDQETSQRDQEATKYEHTDKEQSQDNEEIAPGLEKLSASQVTNQNIQEDTKDEHTDKERNTKIITKKSYFQQYLIEKGLNHQPNGKLVKETELEFCLSMYTDLDVLDEDNKFICKACTAQKQLTSMDDEPALCQVSKQLMIHQLPPVLILHMKRFEIGFYEVTKDDRRVSFPEILDMAPYCTSICLEKMGDVNGQILYGLYAVVVHQGSSLRHGHYIAYVKTRPTEMKEKGTALDDERCHDMHYDEDYCRKGHWHFTSDTYVRECSFEEVKKDKAYMLFYEKLPLTPLPATHI